MAMAESRKLSGGHSQSVISIDVDNEGKVYSGSEEGEFCIWSPEGTLITQQKHGDVGDVTSLYSSRVNPHLLYMSCGTSVWCWDQRDMAAPVREMSVNQEEVNMIKLNPQESFLASCDDSGLVKVINVHEWRVYKTLKKHTNIVSSVLFRPNRPWDLLTAGFDSKLVQWDFSKCRPYCTLDMEDFGKIHEDVTSYLVSLPFIHSMDMSRDGCNVACGTENGHVKIFDGKKRNLEFKCNLIGHQAGVSQVHYPKFETTPNVLLSGGNDCQIYFWNMIETSSTCHYTNGSAATSMEQETEQSLVQENQIRPQHVINHSDKINFLTTASHHNQHTVYVADSSPDVTCYQFPEL